MARDVGDRTGAAWALAAGLAVAGAALWAGGCAGTAGGRGGAERPTVGASAAETVAARGGAIELEFYDELEARPLVSEDDALHAVLLLGTWSSGADFARRVEYAKRLGWLDESFNRSGHDAVTVGEVAMLLERLMGQKPASPTDALERLRKRGMIPPEVQENQGLTGAQMRWLLAEVDDVIGSKRVATLEPEEAGAAGGAPAETPPAPDRLEVGGTPLSSAEASEAPAPPPVSKPANVPAARSEPLPEVPLRLASPAAALESKPPRIEPPMAEALRAEPPPAEVKRPEPLKPESAPLPPKPEATPAKPEAPRPPPPKAEPVKAVPWTSGQPLRKPKTPGV